MSKTEGKPAGLRMGNDRVDPMPDDPTASALAALGGARGMTRIDTGYQTAIVVQRPRDLKKAEIAILYEAAQMGADFIYHWRQKTNDPNLDEGDGKVTIEGMSIDGAMIMVRNWGNVALPTSLEDETPSHFLIRAEFIDLETGFTLPRLYRQRKTGGPGGKMAEDRKEDISFQIAQSKAQRNVVDKALPFWLKARAIEAAKSAAADRFKDTSKWIPIYVTGAAKLGVSEARLIARIGKPTNMWTPYDVLAVDLIFRAIRDRETTVFEEFPEVTAEQEKEAPITVVAEPVANTVAPNPPPPVATVIVDASVPAKVATPAPVPTPPPAVTVAPSQQVPTGTVVPDLAFVPPTTRKRAREPGEEG